MTQKQIDKLKKQIDDVKRALAAEKRKFGGYDDSSGMRYYPPKAYLKLMDYEGGLKYTKWFHKNFYNDIGFPDFLFEWSVILFKTGNLKEAEKKVFETYCSNTYLFDKFFNKPIVPIDKYEYSNIDIPAYTNYFEYSSEQPELIDFRGWLANYLVSEKFIEKSSKFIELNKLLKIENNIETRKTLLDEKRKLKDE
jgi:hypothetical protein